MLEILQYVTSGFWIGVDTKQLRDNMVDIASAFDLGLIMLAIIGFYFGKEFKFFNKK